MNNSSDSEKTNYDATSQAYIAHVERKDSWNNLYERPSLTARFANFSGKNVLDLGCGTGHYTKYTLQQGATVIAVDASQMMLDYVLKKYQSPLLTCIKADIAQGIPEIPDESQDYIICSLVLHYIKNTDFLFEDMYRILKPGGKLYLSTHHPFADYLNLNKESYFDSYLVEDVWGGPETPFTVHYFTKPLSQLMAPIINSSFSILEIDEPLPDEACRQVVPATYARLMTKPGFLFLTLGKHW